MNAKRLTIGEFSRLCRLTVVTLRHYDRVGLLAPAEVDAGTGYRYYHLDQLDVALQIGLLRSLDISIAELRPFVMGSASLGDVLAAQRERLMNQIDEQQRMIDVIDALAKGAAPLPYAIGRGAESDDHVVGIAVATSWVRVERATRHGLARLSVLLRRSGLGTDVATGALFPIEPTERLTVTVFAAVGAADVRPPLERVTLAGGDTISTIHRGDHRLLSYAYRALLDEVANSGDEVTGPAREHYLTTSDGTSSTRLVIPIRARRRE